MHWYHSISLFCFGAIFTTPESLEMIILFWWFFVLVAKTELSRANAQALFIPEHAWNTPLNLVNQFNLLSNEDKDIIRLFLIYLQETASFSSSSTILFAGCQELLGEWLRSGEGVRFWNDKVWLNVQTHLLGFGKIHLTLLLSLKATYAQQHYRQKDLFDLSR